MADVSKIKLPNNSEYDIKDASAIHSVKTINNQSIVGTGNVDIDTSSKNTWYSSSVTQTVSFGEEDIAVTTITGDFSLDVGNIVYLKLQYGLSQSTIYLNVDNTGLLRAMGDVNPSAEPQAWNADGIMCFVYDGTYFRWVNPRISASTDRWGITRLSSSTSSSSTSSAATPSAVKAAYDLANGKQNLLVSGTNIKTINSTSLLGSGNIDATDVFIATYDETSFADVYAAYNAGKTVLAKKEEKIEDDDYKYIYDALGLLTYYDSYEYKDFDNPQITHTGEYFRFISVWNGSIGNSTYMLWREDGVDLGWGESETYGLEAYFNGDLHDNINPLVFYAPTSAGSSGQVLVSSGSGAPTWAAPPTGAINLKDGSQTGSLRSSGSSTESSSYIIGTYAFSEGRSTKASGQASHAEGGATVASGHYSHSQGYETEASSQYGHAEGYQTTASGTYGSHAEGWNTTASGDWSHAEGQDTAASANRAHSEGSNTTASGNNAHAEGAYSVASAVNSHAQNLRTIAASDNQTALGKYNIEDNVNTYAFIVGNGTASNARSNAATLDWSGNTDQQGRATTADMSAQEIDDFVDSVPSAFDNLKNLNVLHDITAGGDITVQGHSSPIGTIKDAYNETAVSLPTATGTAVTSITLEAGTWLVSFGARFSSNANGERRMCISQTAGTADSNLNAAPVDGAITQMARNTVVQIFTETTYYLNLYQTSGSTLSAPASGTNWGNFIRAIRIL